MEGKYQLTIGGVSIEEDASSTLLDVLCSRRLRRVCVQRCREIEDDVL